MRRFALMAIVMGFLASASAHAQATRTWVSGVGDDINPCSRTAPCKTFAGAISKTAASGEINCLDPGGFGSVTLTKSIAIDCTGTLGGVLSAGTTGVIVNDATNTAFVVLRGLDINGAGTGVNGIRFIAGASLSVEDSRIAGITGAGNGIAFNPGAAATLSVVNTVINRAGTADGGGGISVSPTGGGSAKAVLNRVIVTHSFVGVTSNGLSNIQINESNISANATTGILSTGGGSVRVGRSQIVSNAGAATSGSGVLSYGDNQINNNGTDTTPPSAGGYK